MEVCKRIGAGVSKYVFTCSFVAFLSACGAAPAPNEDPRIAERSAELELTSTTDATTASAASTPLPPTIKRIDLLNGVTLEYQEQGVTNGVPIIFIHGYTNSHHDFDFDLPLFPSRYHIFALDLRGHGNSTKPACCYTQNDFAGDVVRFMDRLGIGHASLVGHSMGSFIAQSVALQIPGRIDRLVLIGSAPTVAGNATALGLQSVVNTLADPISPDFVRGFEASTFFEPPAPAFLDTAVSEALKVPASTWKQGLDGLIQENHSALLPRICAPTLILYGDKDVFFSAADQTALDALIPDSTLIVYPNIGHQAPEEAQFRVSRDIQRFIP